MTNVFPIGPAEDPLERAQRLLAEMPPELPEKTTVAAVVYDELERARIDGNFRIIEQELDAGAAAPASRDARIDPDDIRMFWVTLLLTGGFATAAFVASFAGQLAMAENTYLPSYLRFLVPLFIDLPIIAISLNILIFRRRGQSTLLSWSMLAGLTLISATINAVHVLARAGTLDGAPLTLPTALGAGVMAAAPLLVLLTWEELGRLAVRPIEKKALK